jgi:DNA invertase Pin-like site-specific DNA recombinase
MKKRKAGRPPTVPDDAIAEIRRLHLDKEVTLNELSRSTGFSVSHISKIVRGERRKAAPGKTRGKVKSRTPNATPPEKVAEVLRLHAQQVQPKVIARKTDLGLTTVYGIIRRNRK